MNSALLQNKVIMLFEKRIFNRLRVFLLLVLFTCNYITVYSQREPLENHIQEKFEKIDRLLKNNEYDQALIKIEELESYKNYFTVEKNRLTLNLKKAKIFYGINKQKEATQILLKGLDQIGLSSKHINLKIEYEKFAGQIFKEANDLEKSLLYFKKSFYYSK